MCAVSDQYADITRTKRFPLVVHIAAQHLFDVLREKGFFDFSNLIGADFVLAAFHIRPKIKRGERHEGAVLVFPHEGRIFVGRINARELNGLIKERTRRLRTRPCADLEELIERDHNTRRGSKVGFEFLRI